MRLIDYIQEREQWGKLWFSKTEALEHLGCSKISLKQSITSLTQKKRLAPIRGDFVVIVPLNYKSWGITPADWFIDPLMKSLELPYYISTLTAGQYHGAAHQKPQQFQVVTNQYLRDIRYERIKIRFLQNNKATRVPTQRIQVQTGYAILATPEATAFDLCKFYAASGYWSNIGTVLLELLEEVDSRKLCEIAMSGVYDTSVIQRLGHVLSHPDVRGGASIAKELYKVIKPKSFRWIQLTPKQKYIEELGPWQKDDTWKIIITDDIETDI